MCFRAISEANATLKATRPGQPHKFSERQTFLLLSITTCHMPVHTKDFLTFDELLRFLDLPDFGSFGSPAAKQIWPSPHHSSRAADSMAIHHRYAHDCIVRTQDYNPLSQPFDTHWTTQRETPQQLQKKKKTGIPTSMRKSCSSFIFFSLM